MGNIILRQGNRHRVNVAIDPNPLSAAISHSLTETYCQPASRNHMLPAITLASSLVTAAGAQAAVFEVENLNDNGPGSLREAVLLANESAGADAIIFADGVTGTLSIYGEIPIYDSLAIQGPGEANLTIDADGNSRIFSIEQSELSGFTEINDLTLANGSVIGNLNRGDGDYAGGAISARQFVPSNYDNRQGGPGYLARLSLNNVTINDSYSYANGGAISTYNTFLEVNDSTFQGNSTNDDGGAISVEGAAATISGSNFSYNSSGDGGGGLFISKANSAVIDDSSFTNNESSAYGGAIYLDDIYVSALISNSMITGNTASGSGGGIEAFSFRYGAALEINNSTVSSNYASTKGGGIYFSGTSLLITNNSQIMGNTAAGSGGGILFNGDYLSSQLVVADSTVANNVVDESGYGGGIHFYAEEAELVIRNSEITGNSADYGGGIAIAYDGGSGDQYGAITLENATITGNTASGSGGGLFLEVDNADAPIRITDSNISNNSSGNDGGGLFFYFDDGLYTSMVISDTTIDNNSAAEAGGGLWFYDDDGYNVVVENSTISNNVASGNGGGIQFYSDDGALFLRNSTISGNESGSNGGGLYLTHEDGDGRIDNSTIVDNYAYGSGGGLFNDNSEVYIRSSIIANNSSYEGSGDDIAGIEIYAEFSLIGSLDGTTLSGNNNIVYADPLLGPLADNGGATLTHALMAASPAIDAGLNIAPAADDQRGAGFSRMVGLQTDIGAVESDTDTPLVIPAATLTVTNLDDSGPGSLRDAVITANGTPESDVIGFDAGLSGTVYLTSGPIYITDDLIIDDADNNITIDGGLAVPSPRGQQGGLGSRHFVIGGFGKPFRGPTGDDLLAVDLVGLTLTNGSAIGNGGAISASYAELGLNDVTIQYSQSTGDGGGLFASYSVVRITDSTITSNSTTTENADGAGLAIVDGSSLVMRGSNMVTSNVAYTDAGGIQLNDIDSVVIDGATISMNTAGDNGGGIDVDESDGSIVINNSMISYNASIYSGGGINQYGLDEYGDSLTIINTTVSNNSATAENANGGGIFVGESGESLRVLNNSIINNNFAYDNGGGIAFNAESDASVTLEISDSTISSNTANYGNGGGIYVYSNDAALIITGSIISSNTAGAGYTSEDGGSGGGLSIEGNRNYGAFISIADSEFMGNVANTAGGGIDINTGDTAAPIRIDTTTIANNTASYQGGGIRLRTYYSGGFGGNGAFYGGVSITNSTITGNMASNGDSGGIHFYDTEGDDALVIKNTTIADNTANGDGGGISIYNNEGNTLIVNSTISGNSSMEGSGGGIRIDQSGDGAGDFILANTTITGNTATDNGGGIDSDDYSISVISSIVAGNSAGYGNDIVSESTTDFVFSLVGDASGSVSDNGFNRLDVPALLEPLADNGGPTQTHALMAGSPAINAGFNSAASINDQRGDGFIRTQGGRTDIGAFETIANPELALAANGSPFAENGGMATIEVSSTEAVGVTTFIDLSFGGTALLDTDFSTDGLSTFVVAGTDISPEVTLTGIDDPVFEGDEDITITGTDATRGASLSTTAIITDDDPMPDVTLSLVGSPLAENGGMATVTATLSNPSVDDVTVNLALTGTATSGTDFTLPASIVVPAGMLTADITLTGLDDAIDESDETVIIDVDTVTNGTELVPQQVTATIIDDDTSAVSLSLVGDPIAEVGGVATITATLSNINVADVTSTLSFSGTATFGTDFTAPTSIVVPAGDMSADIALTALDDAIPMEGDETVIVDIDTVTNGIEDGVQQVMTTIAEVSTLVTVDLSVTEIDEGGSADIILTLSEPAAADITIELGFSGTAMMPEDFTVSSSMVVIPAGELTGSVQLMVNLDGMFDPLETIIVDIIDVMGGAEDGEQQETLTILEADPVEVPALSDWGKWLIALLLPLAGLLGLRRNKKSGA